MTVGTAAVLAGAGWTLFQTQFGYIDKDKETIACSSTSGSARPIPALTASTPSFASGAIFHDQNDFNTFKDLIKEDLKKIQQDLRRLHDDNLPRSEFKVWQEERTKTIDKLMADVDKTTTRVEQVVRDRASVNLSFRYNASSTS